MIKTLCPNFSVKLLKLSPESPTDRQKNTVGWPNSCSRPLETIYFGRTSPKTNQNRHSFHPDGISYHFTPVAQRHTAVVSWCMPIVLTTSQHFANTLTKTPTQLSGVATSAFSEPFHHRRMKWNLRAIHHNERTLYFGNGGIRNVSLNHISRPMHRMLLASTRTRLAIIVFYFS